MANDEDDDPRHGSLIAKFGDGISADLKIDGIELIEDVLKVCVGSRRCTMRLKRAYRRFLDGKKRFMDACDEKKEEGNG
jgi:hypothetical protein